MQEVKRTLNAATAAAEKEVAAYVSRHRGLWCALGRCSKIFKADQIHPIYPLPVRRGLRLLERDRLQETAAYIDKGSGGRNRLLWPAIEDTWRRRF